MHVRSGGARVGWIHPVLVGATILAAFAVAAGPVRLVHAQVVAAPTAPPQLTDQQIEQFLLTAKVIKTKGVSKGVTGTRRATLSDGTLTHEAQIQTIDEEKARFETLAGVEFNFRDSWKFNVAGYRLDRLIGLNMVPVSVPRRSGTLMAAYTWWIDDVMMEEGDRLKKKLSAPDTDLWNQQMRLVRVFDQLIYNTDRNLGNLLITKDWRIWAIDHGFDEVVVKTKNKFYDMRGTLDHLRFEVVMYERNVIDNAESKVYLSKKLLPEMISTHRSKKAVVQAPV